MKKKNFDIMTRLVYTNKLEGPGNWGLYSSIIWVCKRYYSSSAYIYVPSDANDTYTAGDRAKFWQAVCIRNGPPLLALCFLMFTVFLRVLDGNFSFKFFFMFL